MSYRTWRPSPTRLRSPEVHVTQAQAQSETQDPVHHATVDGPREEVPGEAVLVHRRASRIFQQPQPDGDASQNLVSKSSSEIETDSGSQIHQLRIKKLDRFANINNYFHF